MNTGLTDHERRLFAEAEARDAAGREAERIRLDDVLRKAEGFEHVSVPVRRIMYKVEAPGAVPGAAEAGNPRRAPASAIKDNPLARAARRGDRRKAAYSVAVSVLIAFIIGILASLIFAQANATRLDWPEIQTRAAG